MLQQPAGTSEGDSGDSQMCRVSSQLLSWHMVSNWEDGVPHVSKGQSRPQLRKYLLIIYSRQRETTDAFLQLHKWKGREAPWLMQD